MMVQNVCGTIIFVGIERCIQYLQCRVNRLHHYGDTIKITSE